VQRRETPGEVQASIAALEGMAGELREEAEAEVSAVGIGFGGPVDLSSGRIRRSHQRSGWEDVRLGEVLAGRLGLATYLANDANAGGLGEALFGAAREARSLLYVNVGTGIGGAMVFEGRIHTGATSTAGEIGHCILLPDGPECTCGKRGCLEALSSGTALARRARELLAQAEEPGSALQAIPADDLTGRDVGRAAARGDALALKAVEEAARFLGMGLANAVNLVDPEVVVLGGGVPEMGEAFLQPTRRSFRAHVLPAAANTPLLAAKLGYDAGVIGAAAVALTEQGARSGH
jgi:glucokinase